MEVIKVLDIYDGEFSIAIRKHPEMGHLCGYVGVPRDHPWYGFQYNQCLQGCKGEPNSIKPDLISWLCDHEKPETLLVEVHGGLTFSGEGDGEYLPKGFWWFGFDCAHLGDLMPNFPHGGGTYKDEHYVERECKGLVKQLRSVVFVEKLDAV